MQPKRISFPGDPLEHLYLMDNIEMSENAARFATVYATSTDVDKLAIGTLQGALIMKIYQSWV